jgi:glucoamylase
MIRIQRILKASLSTILIGFLPLATWASQSVDFESWLRQQNTYSLEKLKDNIHPQGTLPGVVVASPSKQDPDYWYHWTRDAALVMDIIVERLIQKDPEILLGDEDFQMLIDYIDFTRSNQASDAPASLGEPKFHVDGRPYRGPWGRPQNDGPALRAHTLGRLALYLLDRGEEAFVLKHLYSKEWPATTTIKNDLEYVSHRWVETDFDLWEEVRGHHFYTRVAQWKSLDQGALLADRLGDHGAAEWYRQQANKLAIAIQNHWDSSQKILRVTLSRDGGLDYKHSGLDASTILAYLHARTDLLPASLDQILSTAEKTEAAFNQVYPLNHRGLPATAIGRYPEDRYFGGNPWFLTTAAYGELHYRTALALIKQGEVRINDLNSPFYSKWLTNPGQQQETPSLPKARRISAESPEFIKLVRSIMDSGDEYLERVRAHAGKDGNLDEQFDRNSGHMLSARDLTWSYASILTAYEVRERAIQAIYKHQAQ